MRLQNVLGSVQSLCIMDSVAPPPVVAKESAIPQGKGWSRTSSELLAYYESKILGHLNVPHKLYQVSLDTNRPELQSLSNEFINTLEIENNSKSTSNLSLDDHPPLVIVHGTALIES